MSSSSEETKMSATDYENDVDNAHNKENDSVVATHDVCDRTCFSWLLVCITCVSCLLSSEHVPL
jgi:hypothetical protein